MKPWITVMVALSLGLSGCETGTRSGVGGGVLSAPPGLAGATAGGVQDITLARSLIENGVVPPESALQVEGMFSEHDFALDLEECEETLCIDAAIGWQRGAGWVQLAMGSDVNMEDYERASLGLVFLVDVSGSMGWLGGEPAQIANDLMDEIIEDLTEDDSVGIVSFSGAATRVLDFIDGDDHDRVRAEIFGMAKGGGTNMEAGLEEVLDMFYESGLDVDQERVILITDAQPNIGATAPGSFMDLAGDLEEFGVALTVVGSGLGLDTNVSDAMVNLTGGNGFSIVAAADVPEFMDDNWPWMASPIAYDLVVDVDPATDFEVGEGYGFPGDGELEVRTVFLSRNSSTLLVRLDPVFFSTVDYLDLEATVTLEYQDLLSELYNDTVDLSIPTDTVLDVGGRYFEHYSTRKAAALANLVQGMGEAARLYGVEAGLAISVLDDVVINYADDLDALLDIKLDDEEALTRELTMAEAMLALMESGAEQGTLYGTP